MGEAGSTLMLAGHRVRAGAAVCVAAAVALLAVTAVWIRTADARAQTLTPAQPAASPTATAATAMQPPCAPPSLGTEALHTKLDDGRELQAWWHAEPSPLRVGRPFALLVTLCPAQARLLRVDAHMPEHRHGMNYRPTLQALGAGLWRAEGLLWHMPGRWELLLEAGLDSGEKHRLAQTVLLR